MQQMPVHEDAIIDLDYSQADLPEPVREFRPTVYKDGDAYCCILGPDPQAGIFGCGRSVEAAISDWNDHFTERMSEPPASDEVVQYILDTRATSKKNVW